MAGATFGHTFGMRVDGAAPRGFLRFLGLTAFPAEGCGGGFAAIKRGRGWRRGLCRRVVFASAQGATAAPPLRVADCPSGNAYKVSVTDSPFCVIWHDKHSAELSAFGRYTPYPAAPDFSTGKRVTRFSGRFAPLRIVFPCHPYAGGRIKHRETIFS